MRGMMQDLSFNKGDRCWVLCVRGTNQVGTAESFFREYGIEVSFTKVPYWYRAELPLELPEKLVRSLQQRAKRRVPRRTAGPL